MRDSNITPKFADIRNWRVLMCHNGVKIFINSNSNFLFLLIYHRFILSQSKIVKKIIGRLQKATYFIVQTGALIVCTDTWQKSLHFLFISNFLPYWEPAWSQFLISLTVTRLKLTPKSTEFGATFLILHILYNLRHDAPNFDKIILKGWHFEKKYWSKYL